MVYTTATYVEQELQASATFDTSTTPTLETVNRWIDEVDDYIEELAGRSFENTSYSEIIDYDGRLTIPLRHSPLTSVTRVLYTEYPLGSSDYALSNTASASTDYSYTEYNGTLLITRPSIFLQGPKTIQVDYNAGYATIPSTVQMLATKLVAQRVLNSLLNSNVNTGNDGGEISVGSIKIVEPASYGVNSFKELGNTIKELEQNIIGKFRVHRYNG